MNYVEEIVKLVVATSHLEKKDDADVMDAYRQFINGLINNLLEVTNNEDVLRYVYVYLQSWYRRKNLLTSL